MEKYSFVMEVEEIDPSEAYNHDRPVSSLLMHQVRHLHAAEQHLPEKERTGINITQLHTELDASTYIQQVTEKLIARKRKLTLKRTPSKGTALKTKSKASRKTSKTAKKSSKKHK